MNSRLLPVWQGHQQLPFPPMDDNVGPPRDQGAFSHKPPVLQRLEPAERFGGVSEGVFAALHDRWHLDMQQYPERSPEAERAYRQLDATLNLWLRELYHIVYGVYPELAEPQEPVRLASPSAGLAGTKRKRPEEDDEAVDAPDPKAPRRLVEPADKVEHKWRLNVRLPRNVDPDTVVLGMNHKEGWLGVLWRDMNDPREPDEFHHHLLMPDPKVPKHEDFYSCDQLDFKRNCYIKLPPLAGKSQPEPKPWMGTWMLDLDQPISLRMEGDLLKIEANKVPWKELSAADRERGVDVVRPDLRRDYSYPFTGIGCPGVDQSLADSDFHGHRSPVKMSWV
jgi:hypothetical protein